MNLTQKLVALSAFIVLTVASCSFPVVPNVTTKVDIYDQVYSENSGNFESLMTRLQGLDGLADFGEKPEPIEEPYEMNFIKLLISLDSIIDYDSVANPLTLDNCLMLFDKSNQKTRVEQMSIMSELFDSSRSWSVIEPHEETPVLKRSYEFDHFWHYYLQDSSSKISEDSLTQSEADRLTAKLEKRMERLFAKKYALLINDIAFNKPYLISEDTFESGLLLIQTELYELASGNIIARELHSVDNDDLIEYTEYENSGRAESLMNMSMDRRLLNNLLSHRNVVIMQDYGIEETEGGRYID